MCRGLGISYPAWMSFPFLALEWTGQTVVRGVDLVAKVGQQAVSASQGLAQLLHPDVISQALEADPNNPQLYLQRARLSFAAAAQMPRQQKKAFREALEAALEDASVSASLSGRHDQPARMEALFLVGLALDLLGRWAEAAQTFDDAIRACSSIADGSPRALQEEKEEASDRPLAQHKYLIKTFVKPTFCEHCKYLLVGLRHQGSFPSE